MSLFHQDVFFWRLINLLKSLSTEQDHWSLLQAIMSECQGVTHCDGSTLYLVNRDAKGSPQLVCSIIHNETLGIHQNYAVLGHSALPPIKISADDSDHKKTHSLAAYSAINGMTTCVEDIYKSAEFNTQGVQSFDELFGYRTRSLLSVPIMNQDQSALGVIQFINPLNPLSGTVAHYSGRQISIVEGLAALMATILAKLEFGYKTLN